MSDTFKRVLLPLPLVLLLAGCSETSRPVGNQSAAPSSSTAAAESPAGILPEVGEFLGQHKEFGKPVTTEAMPDWAGGKRQRVSLDVDGKRRSLLFYIKGQQVVTVYEDDATGGRKKVWGDSQK